jgi:hypothetical protein
MGEDERKPSRVIVWQNGMVMVFDAAGEQVPEYRGQRMQGPVEEVRAALAAIVPPGRWERGDWQSGRIWGGEGA